MTAGALAIVAAYVVAAVGISRAALAAPRRRVLAGLALAAAVAALWFFAARHTAVRGGYDDDHDFVYLAAAHGSVLSGDWLVDKESSPVLLFRLADALGGRSLGDILALHKVLAVLSALLVYGFLRRLKAGVPAAALGASLVFFCQPTLLNVYGFSTTMGNFVLVCAALFSLAPWVDKESQPDAALSAAALFLLYAARFELFLPLAAGCAAAAGLRYKSARRSWLAWAGALAAACAVWTLVLRTMNVQDPSIVFRGGPHPFVNLTDHFGRNFLTPMLGTPQWLGAIAGTALIAAGLGTARREKGPRRLWLAFLSAWAAYAAVIYLDMEIYPLQFPRHTLYLLLPYFLLAALLFERWELGKRKAWVAACLVAIFAALNLRGALGLNDQLRTNDLEWQLLLDARRDWPAGCVAAGAIGPARGELIRRYFPTEGGSGCRLIYRSPNYQVLRSPDYDALRPAETLLGEPVLERTIRHRFYTVWHVSPRHPVPDPIQEITDPVELKLGFYRLSEKAPPLPPELAALVLF